MYDQTLIRLLAVEAELSITACNACHRKGLPILPLRRALMPKPNEWWSPWLPADLSNEQLGLRTLRNGYLYVLLDNTVWQAYQVTPDGYLRQFTPWAPPLSNDTPLAQACINADHDMPASFFTIDTTRYRHAAIAFASDPWPARVLDAYKAGKGAGRLLKLDLTAARNDPASVGLAMTAEDPRTADEVYEYQAFVPGFNSVHGFNTRADRRLPFRNFIRSAITTHDLEHGVLGLVLDDSVGLVQEYNGLRAGWAYARQVWMEEPDRAYQQQTSQILLAIRALNRQVAETKVKTPAPHLVPPDDIISGAWEKERSRRVEGLQQESNERLGQRYDEPRRAAFQRDYDEQLKTYQAHIDHYAALYAEAFNAEPFRLIEQYDYTAYDEASVIAYCKTLSLCLRGGISEAPGDESGPTAQLWQTLLNDPASPVYRALLRNDQNWMSLLTPHFNPDGPVDWRDSTRLYTLITQIAASPEGQKLYRAHLQEAVAQLLAALNSSSLRLKELIHPGVQSAVSRLNTLSQLVYNGVHLIELRVEMKLREYYALQSEHIRSMQNSLARDGKGATSAAAQKVRPLIMGGLLNLSILDPKIADLSIKTTVWVEGTIDDLKTMLDRDAGPASELGSVHNKRIATVTVGVGTLDPLIGKTWKEFKVSSHLAQSWVRNGFAGLKGVAKSAQLLIGLGSLYLLNDAMNKNLKAAEEAIGDKSPEARIALQGSTLAVLGAGIEVVGAALKGGASGMQATGMLSHSLSGMANSSIKIGGLAMKAGSVIIAITGLFDATQAALAARRSINSGDKKSAQLYTVSTGITSLAALTGIVAAAAGMTALVGALGIALILSLTGYAFYKMAESKESSKLERWVMRCYYGLATENPKIHWSSHPQASIAVAELNAVVMGLDVELDLRIEHTGYSPGNIPTQKFKWSYCMSLPYFEESRSAYQWSITFHRKSDGSQGQNVSGQVVAHESFNGPSIEDTPAFEKNALRALGQASRQDYLADTAVPKKAIRSISPENDISIHIMTIQGVIELISMPGKHAVEAVSLNIKYWPDINRPESYAQITKTKNQ